MKIFYFLGCIIDNKIFQVLSKVQNSETCSSVPAKGTKRKAASSCTQSMSKKGKVTKSQ